MDINEAIREVIELTRGEAAKTGVSVQTHLAEGLPLIHGDRVQLQQVILNLIINAVEAMSGIARGTARVADHHRARRAERRARRGAGHRSGTGAGDRRAPLRGLLHHQAQRLGNGPIDLPLDHRSAWGTIVGGGERTARCYLSVLDAGEAIAGVLASPNIRTSAYHGRNNPAKTMSAFEKTANFGGAADMGAKQRPGQVPVRAPADTLPPIRVNRAPVLTLWAAVVAECLGYPLETALTFGRFITGHSAGHSAHAKARRLGGASSSR